jgi:hypothetical protein
VNCTQAWLISDSGRWPTYGLLTVSVFVYCRKAKYSFIVRGLGSQYQQQLEGKKNLYMVLVPCRPRTHRTEDARVVLGT